MLFLFKNGFFPLAFDKMVYYIHITPNILNLFHHKYYTISIKIAPKSKFKL